MRRGKRQAILSSRQNETLTDAGPLFFDGEETGTGYFCTGSAGFKCFPNSTNGMDAPETRGRIPFHFSILLYCTGIGLMEREGSVGLGWSGLRGRRVQLIYLPGPIGSD